MATPKIFLPLAAVRSVAAGLALLVGGAGCSSGGDGAPLALSPGSTSPEAGTDAGSDASSLTEEQLDACYQLDSQVSYRIESATGANEYPNTIATCTTDDDCVVVDDSTRCGKSCGVVIAKSHAASYARAVASADAALCGDVSDCPGATGACSAIGAAACYGGTCTFGLPAAWQSFVLETDTGGSGAALPAACSGTSCTLWTVTPDAKVSVTDGASTLRSATLSSADFATLDGVLRSAELRQQATSGTTCPRYEGTEHASESVVRSGIAVGGDVSSCVAGMFVGDAAAAYATNDYLQLYNVLKGY